MLGGGGWGGGGGRGFVGGNWPPGLRPERTSLACRHRQSPGKSHTRPALPRGIQERPAADRGRRTLARGRGGSAARRRLEEIAVEGVCHRNRNGGAGINPAPLLAPGARSAGWSIRA